MLGTVILSGIATGLLYSLVGIGLVIIYRTSRVLNFAQGDLVTVTAYGAFTLLVTAQVAYPVAFVLTLAVGALVGAAFYYLVAKPLSRRQGGWLRVRGIHEERATINVLIGTIAASMILEGAEPYIWGHTVVTFDALFSSGAVRFLGMVVSYNNLAIIVISVVTMLALILFFRLTSLGKTMEAAFDNPIGAELVGVRIERVYVAAWVISGLLSALAALLATPVTYLTNTSLVVFIFSAFAAIVLGGFTSFTGAIVGGLLFGVVKNLVTLYLSARLEQVFIFVMIMVILFIRPSGLFGKDTGVKRV